ncbi:helix-turn-helix transcriptional regulator [Ornithinibacillus halophilus]|uniref:Predicted DNA-binding transcriptional regulator YafY, contains an HTH and WYL domains n=1 Tax=Ornithinibacillus halophilus TaxID=930117 RepID=A0A1M5GLI9_9BACI|nr:WYL domain-containing protein [Ornithinibacillus halophilus]SHG04630.1 Predicted DNA-binding transcriptional regulator YafY, contains an HTH and WYL domains [Ornithinibacillus halophilus]
MIIKIYKTDRILALIDVLKSDTDEYRGLTVRELTEKVNERFGYDADITQDNVKDDLRTLHSSKFTEIHVENRGKGLPNYYSYLEREFDFQEIRFIMDAISSARFIPKIEKESIIEKVKKFTSESIGTDLKNQLYINNIAIEEAKKLKYHAYNLHKAIHDSNIIQFRYGKYNVNKEFILSKDGKVREAKPYALVWSNDYYYLIAQKLESDDLVQYRVDRMVDVHITEKNFQKDPYFNIEKYLNSLFNMYPGEVKDLKVRFDNHLINVIIDRFGIDVSIEQDGEQYFILRTKAAISDGLVRWLLTWGSDAQVIDPPELVLRMKEESKKMNQIYSV